MDKAMQQAVMMIGGMAIARAVNDETLSRQLLQVCQAALIAQE